MLISIILIVLSIVVLFYGAEFSLDACEKVGRYLGLSPLIIGMLLIGFGTSLPEFFVGHIAAIKGKTDIAVGSLVGSNIANMFLILGVSGLIARLPLTSQSIRNHLSVHLLLSIVLALVLSFKVVNILSSIALFAVAVVYLFYIFKDMDKNFERHKSESRLIGNPTKLIMKLLLGFSMLYLGGELLVKGGTDICEQLGVSEFLISAIFIAFGTSFPELVTSIVAAVKKKNTDLIVGNIIGSNMFNCSLILGSLGIYDFELPGKLVPESAALIFGAIILIFVSIYKNSFFRFPAFVFITSYGAIVSYWIGLI